MIRSGARLKALLGGSRGEFLYKGKRYSFVLESRPSCSSNCPAGINVKGYVNLIADKRYEEALALIREANPFPAVCGRVCTHPCEANCGQIEVDGEPISIKALKRFVADYEVSRKDEVYSAPPVRYREKVAVVGSGPAGLTAAVDLRRFGYQVTVFEAMEKPGGMLVWGIPDFRLPRKVVKREIEIISSTGVKIETRKRIENPISLLSEGYHAVVLAAGCWQGISLKIEGSHLVGVVDCLDFLKKVYLNEIKEVRGKVVVVGGGDSAFDAARTALRLGAEKVTVAYRRTEKEMPASASEVKEALEEGIKMLTLVVPKRVLGKERVEGLECLRAKLGEVDETGRKRPVPVEGTEFVLDCELLITAIGSKPHLPNYKKFGVALNSKGLIKVDGNYKTTKKGIFAVGDVVRGPSTVVEVIGEGHLCAESVHLWLRGKEGKRDLREKKERFGLVVKALPSQERKRVEPPKLEPEKRKRSFEEVEKAYTEYSALKEAARCLRCGSCYECYYCIPECDSKQLLARLNKEELLLKVPFELSKEVYSSSKSEFLLKTEEKEVKVEVYPLTPRVVAERCIACGRCELACAYRAIRIGLKASGEIYSYIDHNLCRSCGRCVFVCPTGAISLEFYSEEKLREKIKKSIEKNNGIAIFSCHWSLPEMAKDRTTVEVMCSVGISPYLILFALSTGARGVLILHCGRDKGHYLDSGYGVGEMVKRARELLEFTGLSANLVKEMGVDKENFEEFLDSFKKELETLNPEPLPVFEAPLSWNGRPAKETAILSNLSKRRDGLPSLLLKGKVLELDGLPHTIQLLKSVEKIKTLLGIEEKAASVPEELEEKESGKTLPELLIGRIKIFKTFERKLRIGIHFHGKEKEKPFYTAFKSIFENLGCKVVALEPENCGETGWRKPDAKSRQKGVEVVKKAEKLGVEVLLPVSAECLTHLKVCSRPLGWRHSEVKVEDAYSFLLSFLEGGAEDD